MASTSNPPPPALERTTTGTTAYYSIANPSAATLQPPTTSNTNAMPSNTQTQTNTAPATIPAQHAAEPPAVPAHVLAPGLGGGAGGSQMHEHLDGPSPDYHAGTNGNGYGFTDTKAPLNDEKVHPTATDVDNEKAGGTSGSGLHTVVAPGSVLPQTSTSTNAATGVEKETGGSPTLSQTNQRKDEQLNQHAVGTFASGAVIPNPTSDPNEPLTERSATADASLTDGAKSKILKSEAKNSKQMSKILKSEAKAQAASHAAAVKDLARLQSVQKSAAAEESRALQRHTKALAADQKQSAIFAKAKAAFEAAQAELKSAADNLEQTREHAKQQSESLRVKTLEVEQATRQKATDDREREVKLAELKALRDNAPKSGLGCF